MVQPQVSTCHDVFRMPSTCRRIMLCELQGGDEERLFAQDFVKWRGALFHRFTVALVDSSEAIRKLANFLLADALSSKVGRAKSECLFPAEVY